MASHINGGSVAKRVVGSTSVELRPADAGWLVLVADAHGPTHNGMYLSYAQADALLMLLLTHMYGASEVDAEIALTTLASLDNEDEGFDGDDAA